MSEQGIHQKFIDHKICVLIPTYNNEQTLKSVIDSVLEFTTNILVVNNYRDIDEDRIANKNTLAVKLGKTFTRLQYVSFMIISYLVPFVVYVTFKNSPFVFLPLLSFPLSVKLVKMIYKLEGSELNKTLELTAKLSGIYAILFAIGIIL